eukprot:2696547-Rhodomonas_salina.2
MRSLGKELCTENAPPLVAVASRYCCVVVGQNNVPPASVLVPLRLRAHAEAPILPNNLPTMQPSGTSPWHLPPSARAH